MFHLFILILFNIFMSVILPPKTLRVTVNVVFRRTGAGEAGGECVIDPDDGGQWPGHNPPIIIDEVISINIICPVLQFLSTYSDWQLHPARQDESEVHH